MNTPKHSDAGPTVTIDTGNLAELNLIAFNPVHVTHVRLNGEHRGSVRKLDIHFVSGEQIGWNFETPETAQAAFDALRAALDHTQR